MNTADAILSTLQSPNVADSNFEAANVVDVLNYVSAAGRHIARAITPNAHEYRRDGEHMSPDSLTESINRVANAITPLGVAAGQDATGGRIESLTEAAMGITAGLCRIADAIETLAEAVRDKD